MMHTFESLARASKSELDRLMDASPAPLLDDLLGFEYRGWNLNATTRVFGTRKFKKGFFGSPQEGEAWGYNVAVKQNDFAEPWLGDPNDEDPKRHYFFKVFPGHRKSRYPNSIVVDYRASGEYFAANPVGYTVDYLVCPEPANADLILGKSYLEMGFLKPFLGYFVLEKHNASGYGRAAHFFTQQELRTVEAFAEVFIEGEDEVLTPPEIAANIERYLSSVRSSRTQSLKLTLFVIEHLLPRRSWWPFRQPFSKMSVRERREFIAKGLANEKSRGLLRDLAKIRTLFVAGYYSDPRTYPDIKFETVEERPVRRNHLMLLPREWPQLTDAAGDIDCDVCVIGSGAAGAIVAYRAQQAGRNVVLLEEGPCVTAEQTSNREVEMTARLYKEGGLQATVDYDLSILQGKCLGGTTVINNAICFRLQDEALSPGGRDVLAEWQAIGARIDRAQLNASFERVEQMLDVRPLLEVQDPGVPAIDGPNAHVLLAGWGDVQRRNPAYGKYKSGLFKKNYHKCLGCGYCNFGCRWGRKMSMLETYIPAAQKLGARIVAEAHAKRIEIDGRTARAVHCVRADGRALRVRAKSVVVSCGAIGSSVLLMKSGVTHNVGERFSFNAGTPVFARFPNLIRGFDGLQMAAYIDGVDYLLESLFYPPVGFGAALPGWFNTHFERMRDYTHFACAGVLIGTDHNGRVKRIPQSRSMFGPVDYRMTDRDLDRLRHGQALLAYTYFVAGADYVLPATFADRVLDRATFGLSTPDQIYDQLRKWIRQPEDVTLSSAHPQGGNPMSDDASMGVVDSQFRVHGHDNLFVCDASVFPTTIGINPQLTIMAVADYFGGSGVF